MKKVLVLGWYWNVGQVVVKDLLDSNFFVWIWWRDWNKIDIFSEKLNSKNIEKVIIDFKNEEELFKIFKNYDLIVNCLEYTFNQLVIDICIKSGKNYVDLWDNYEWIKISRSKDWLAKESWIVACLWAGSAPWIVNVLTKYVAKKMKKVETLTISFVDEIKNSPEKMLPFNFMTVVDEILWDALLFEWGKYKLIKWWSKIIDANFCKSSLVTSSCNLTWSYVTNHDEQFSLPQFLSEKWIKNVYFVMKHSENVINLIKSLNEFWFLSKEKIKWVEISPLEFTTKIMNQLTPQNFYVEDKESLFIKLDDTVIEIINQSVNWVPAWIMNTWIWCSIISQYLLNNELTPWIYHPEDFVNGEWFIKELKKRDFDILINNEKK